MRQIDEELLYFINVGDYRKIVDLLNEGADPNCKHGYDSAIMVALGSSYIPSAEKIEVVKLLVSKGADPLYTTPVPYAWGSNALMRAQEVEIVEYLIDAGAKVSPEDADELMYTFYGNMQIKRLFKEKGIKTQKWVDNVRQVYFRVKNYDGCFLYDDVLKEAIPVIRKSFLKLERYKVYDPNLSVDINDAEDFYAIHRVNEVLLLNFQNGYNGKVKITVDEYNKFWSEAGLSIYKPKEFHPFSCEIQAVKECEEQLEPQIISRRWPCLMFGDLLFSRAGVCISASPDMINKEIAEHSVLFWSHVRNDRKYNDLSLFWGNTSQWATSFRLDYWHEDNLYFNVNHFTDDEKDDFEDDLTEDGKLEILKYRCFVKTAEPLKYDPYSYYAHEKYMRKELALSS